VLSLLIVYGCVGTRHAVHLQFLEILDMNADHLARRQSPPPAAATTPHVLRLEPYPNAAIRSLTMADDVLVVALRSGIQLFQSSECAATTTQRDVKGENARTGADDGALSYTHTHTCIEMLCYRLSSREAISKKE